MTTNDLRIPFVDGDFDFWPMYDRGEWEPETLAVLRAHLSPGDLFLDIGAWIGPVTLWAASLGADVLALEPDPVAHAQLIHNVKIPPAVTTVEVLEQALAPKTGTSHLVPFREDYGFGDSQSRLSRQGDGLAVRTVAPFDLFRGLNRRPALVKCDIEGGEIDIYKPLAVACRVAKSPLLLSWHEPWWPAGAPTATARKDWFDRLGFVTTPIRGDGWRGFDELLAVPV